jgi:hypothetical protein
MFPLIFRTNKRRNKMEIWKDIEQYPGYQVSNQGQIKSFK